MKGTTRKLPKCPFCGSRKVVRSDGWSVTLVGGGSTTDGSEGDPNHHHGRLTCECGKVYAVHVKGGKTWTTDDEGYLLTGAPNCFETYGVGRERDDEARASKGARALPE